MSLPATLRARAARALLASLAPFSLACSAPAPSAPASSATAASPAASAGGPRVTRIGVLTGHGEDGLSSPHILAESEGRRPSVRSLMAQAFPAIQLEDIDLRQGAVEIDAGLSALLITQPAVAYSEAERRRIDAFLMRGGKGMAVFVSAAHLRPGDPRFLATLAPTGLEPLLASYGIDLHDDVVSDDKASLRIPVPRRDGGTGWIRSPALLTFPPTGGSTLDRAFAPFAKVTELSVPFASSLAIAPERQPGCTVAVRARTSPWSWLATDAQQDLGLRTVVEPPPDLEAAPIAASVEGRLSSASGAPAAGTSGGRTRLFVLASGYFLTNPFARQGQAADGSGEPQGDATLRQVAMPYSQKYATATLLVLKNTLGWVTGADAP